VQGAEGGWATRRTVIHSATRGAKWSHAGIACRVGRETERGVTHVGSVGSVGSVNRGNRGGRVSSVRVDNSVDKTGTASGQVFVLSGTGTSSVVVNGRAIVARDLKVIRPIPSCVTRRAGGPRTKVSSKRLEATCPEGMGCNVTAARRERLLGRRNKWIKRGGCVAGTLVGENGRQGGPPGARSEAAGAKGGTDSLGGCDSALSGAVPRDIRS